LTVLGVVSDTHGRFDPRLREVFAGVTRIVHAGDVGAADVLTELAAIAPVTAVRGNVDIAYGLASLPDEATFELEGRRVLVGHVKTALLGRHAPALEGYDLVITGHSHRFTETRVDGVLYLNPGAAGAPRFGLARSVAVVEMGETLAVRRIELE